MTSNKIIKFRQKLLAILDKKDSSNPKKKKKAQPIPLTDGSVKALQNGGGKIRTNKNFLYSLLPKSGKKCVVIKKNHIGSKPSFHHHWFKSRNQAFKFIMACKSVNRL